MNEFSNFPERWQQAIKRWQEAGYTVENNADSENEKCVWVKSEGIAVSLHLKGVIYTVKMFEPCFIERSTTFYDDNDPENAAICTVDKLLELTLNKTVRQNIATIKSVIDILGNITMEQAASIDTDATRKLYDLTKDIASSRKAGD